MALGTYLGHSPPLRGPSATAMGRGLRSPEAGRFRKFPESAAAWAAAFPSVAVPSHIWTFQEASGDVLDKVGSVSLIANSITLYRQTGDPEPQDSPRFHIAADTAGSTDRFDAFSGATGNIGTGSLSMYVRFRCPDVEATQRSIASKGGSAPNWQLVLTSNGNLRFRINTADAGSPYLAQIQPARYDDNIFHDCLFIVNRTTNIASIVTEFETNSVSIADMATDVSNGTAMRILNGSGGVDQALEAISYIAMWDSTALNIADLTTIRAPI